MQTVKIKKSKTKMIAHRGLSGIEPQNTSIAFAAAGNRSYFGIETDVHITKDGKYVIIHDDVTSNVSNTGLTVENTDFEVLRNIYLNDNDGSAHQFFTLVATLYTHIFVFDFVDFSVSKQQCFRQRPTGRVWFQAGRAFVLLFKAQGGFRLAAGGIVDFFLDRDTLFGQSSAGCIGIFSYKPPV